jgi:hypothetical protein
MKPIQIKIDVTKIDKSKLYKGQKGTYLDAVILVREETDQYGNNGMIIQSVSKEEREAGVRGAILGNCKVEFGSTDSARPAPNQSVKTPIVDDSVDDDTQLPF